MSDPARPNDPTEPMEPTDPTDPTPPAGDDPAHETRVEEALAPEERQASDRAVAPPPPPSGPFEAKAGSYFRNVRYVIAAAIVLMGAYFAYDGWVGYPDDNANFQRLQQLADEAQERGETAKRAEFLDQQRDYKEHSDFDILLQKLLGVTLPPLGIALLVRWLYISRGRIRLDEGDVLHLPGHPPIPASSVTKVDDRLWDRKGISRISYRADGRDGTAKLDDFVYERKPIDAIHDRLLYLSAGGDATPGA